MVRGRVRHANGVEMKLVSLNEERGKSTANAYEAEMLECYVTDVEDGDMGDGEVMVSNEQE